MVINAALVAGIVGLVTGGFFETRDIDRCGGIMLRRERRRIISATLYASAAVAWTLLFRCLDRPVTHGMYTVAVHVSLLWPVVLMVTDMWTCRTHVDDHTRAEQDAADTRGSGNWIVGAVFAAGMLLSVMNKCENGHVPPSAKIMLLGMVAVIAFLVPRAPGAPDSDLAWGTRVVQRTALHMAIGLFMLATALACQARGGVPASTAL